MKQISMADYLRLEIKRLADLGFDFPDDPQRFLRQRAKHLDKIVMANRTRRAFSGHTIDED